MARDKLQQLLHELHQQGTVISSDLRDALAAALNKLPLVSQQEFDIQADILRRTQQKLAQLEQQVQQLEQKLNTKPTHTDD